MATWTKLKDGRWGIRVDGTARAGESVTVQKKDGTSQTVTIAKVLWTGEGKSLCAVADKGNGGGSSYGTARRDGHRCRNGHATHPGPCCTGRHVAGYDCGCDCCDLD